MRHSGAGLAIPTFPDVFGGVVPPTWTFGIGIHYLHRVGALLVALAVTATAARILRAHRGECALVLPALGALVVLVAQIALGASVVLTQKAVLPNTLHVATGAVLLGTCLVLALEARRAAPPAALPRAAAAQEAAA
jgi:cytochrome c oxidase assembly protein subunit 15